MADFPAADLRGARFDRADLTGAQFFASDLSEARFRGVDMTRVTMRGVELVDVDIDGEIINVTVNGVAIGPLIEAELDRRNPDRVKMRPDDPDGFREAWEILGRLWDQTVTRARRLPPELLHESVDGEWSFIETLRHLVFATDAWVSRAIGGDPSPWHPLGLQWDEGDDMPGVPRDRDVRPSLDVVLELRRDRMSTVAAAARRPDRRVAQRGHHAGRRSRLAAPPQLPGARVPADRPQRGMVPPPVRRARPGRPWPPGGSLGSRRQSRYPPGARAVTLSRRAGS